MHLEGFAVLSISIYLYGYNQFSWILFFVLLFSPDLSMLGYIVNNRIGAIIYNLFHTYFIAILDIICGLLIDNQVVLAIGLIWSAHILRQSVGRGRH